VKLRRHLAGSALAAWLFACNTPTIPLPPPAPEAEDVVVSVYAADPTRLVFAGDPAGPRNSFPGGSLVTIFDDDSGHGALVTADAQGRFESDPVTAAVGDDVRIWYEDDNGRSSDLCLVVAVGRQGGENLCPP
jgi:hypothetical protein